MQRAAREHEASIPTTLACCSAKLLAGSQRLTYSLSDSKMDRELQRCPTAALHSYFGMVLGLREGPSTRYSGAWRDGYYCRGPQPCVR